VTASPDTALPAPVAVVTGAGSGLGRVISHALLAEGFRVALLGRTPRSLEETATAAPGPVLVLPADVSSASDVEAAFASAVDAWGRVDLLVNNAGVFGPSGDIDEVPVDEWRRTVDINLVGSFLCARAAFGVMKAQKPQGGRIVNIGSVSAQAPRPGSSAYTATKHAITGLTKSLSLDGRPYTIACAQLDIGNAETAMTRDSMRAARQADGSVRAEPLFDPEHVGRLVRYIATLPLDVNAPFVTLMATTMPLVGRG
jgi:NAD(P)-dependent dehydrogenase (short-subunit alcohol dehydrogenase family)